MTLVNVPGCDVTSLNDPACNLAAYLDRVILGENHIWNQSRVYDPDGLLSTIPAMATTLAGVLTGQWLRSDRGGRKKALRMFLSGTALFVIGWIWSFRFPLNKSLWTSSYVVFTAGLALIFLAICNWFVDLKGYKKWSTPFVIFGTNAIALYIGSTIFGKTLDIVELAAPHDATITLQEKIYGAWFAPLASPINASLMYAIAFVLIWLFLMWLFYRKRIFIKV
jgi:predicted acyltransferase